MKIDYGKVFIITNPLFWVFAIVTLLYIVFTKVFDFLGISDWYYVLFGLNGMSEDAKIQIIQVMRNKKLKMLWLKRKAWEYAVKQIELEL